LERRRKVPEVKEEHETKEEQDIESSSFKERLVFFLSWDPVSVSAREDTQDNLFLVCREETCLLRQVFGTSFL